MVTPAGAPAWVRTVSHLDYGGHPSKRNYLSQGVIDALTDVGAEELARLAADAEAYARTASFAEIRYLCNDSVPAAPTVEFVHMMTGVRLTSYAGDAPPTGFPSAARNGTGDVTFTFASSYSDPYGVSGAYTPAHAHATPNTTVAAIATCVISGQTVRVRAFDAAGAPLGDGRYSLSVL